MDILFMLEILKILIVEDDSVSSLNVQMYLEKVFGDSVSIFTAKTIQQATSILVSHSISIVLLDLNLPDSHGYETVKKIRLITSIPIVIVTGLDDSLIKAKSLASGFDVISKDDITPLIQKIIDAVEHFRRKKEEGDKISSRLDSIFSIIEDLNTKLGVLIPIQSQLDALNKTIYGDNGIEKRLVNYEKKATKFGRWIWGIGGLAGGGAITALITWLINYWLNAA